MGSDSDMTEQLNSSVSPKGMLSSGLQLLTVLTVDPEGKGTRTYNGVTYS